MGLVELIEPPMVPAYKIDRLWAPSTTRLAPMIQLARGDASIATA